MKTYHSTIEPLEQRIAPATIIVTNPTDTPVTGKLDLRQALLQADADLALHPGVVNTIIFHLPAPPAHSENIITLTNGELTSLGDVTITGPGAGKLIIDGNEADRVLEINDHNNTGPGATDSPATISGLSIINGKTSAGGGGIYSTESLTLKNVIVSGCAAAAGGGVTVYSSSATGLRVSISGSQISGNTASSVGGGMDLYGIHSLAIKNTVVTGNNDSSASTGAGGIYAELNETGTGMAITGCRITANAADHGGGLFVNSFATGPTVKATISGSTISGNVAKGTGAGGGGLYVQHGNVVVTGCSLLDNKAVYDGGGIEAKGFASLTISNCTISGNATTMPTTASGGGGVFIVGNQSAPYLPVHITGSHIIANQSALDGGGVLASDGIALTISGTTFSANDAIIDGGGISTSGTGINQVDLTVTGSTFSDNVGGYATFTGNSSSGGGGGGGISAYGGALSIITSRVIGNFGGTDGGGLDLESMVSATLKNVVVSDNVACLFSSTGGIGAGGGGLFLDATPTFSITGGSFIGNEANQGGGITIFNSTGSILGVAISGNAATSKGGGVSINNGVNNNVTLQVAKVTGNSAPSSPDVFGTFT